MRSMYIKFIAFTLTIMLISSLFAFLISNAYYQQKLKKENDAKNSNIALQVVNFIENNAEINFEDYLQNTAQIGYQIYLLDELGKEKYFGAPFRKTNLSNNVKQSVLNGNVFHGMLEFPRETFVTGFFANELENTIGVPLTFDNKKYALFIRPNIKMLFNEMHYLFAWLLILIITISIVLVVISTKYLIQPIAELTKATKRLANNNFNVELDINRNDELGELAKSFLKMAQQLEQTELMRKEFISNVSHDIQSPLSNIKGYTNLLSKSSTTEEDKETYIKIIDNEVVRLSLLTKQLLLLASLDYSDEILKREKFDISEQIKQLIDNYQWQINEQQLMISYSLPPAFITGDPALLYTVMENLLTNAIKYSEKNGYIDIVVTEKQHSVIVSFVDNGIGMSEDQRERVFEPFYRADSSRTKSISGTGLGLAIVQTIIMLHDGQIIVKSKEGFGSTFTIVLQK